MRRHFRMHPELGGEEHETQARVMQELTAMGLTPRAAGGTGVIAEIQGAAAGKTVALRADIDALPLEDEIDKSYRSRRSGVCHACGHDGHTAMLLGAARILTGLRADFSGTVRLLFQPSEEKFPGGAQPLIDAGALDGAAAVVGAHLWQPIPLGLIGVNTGPVMASPDEFTIRVQGRGGHGSMPQQTVDPILVGAQLVLSLRTIIGANVDAHDRAVLTVGSFKSGEAFNIIPDTAVIKGTVRTFDKKVRDTIFAHIEASCRGICSAAGASCTLEPVLGYPPVVNNQGVAAVVAAAGREVVGADGVQEFKPLMVGEDFSIYQQTVPGVFFLVGAGNPAKGLLHPHHHPKFDFDEDALGYGCETMVRAALKLLAR
ncbi:MAG: amidohydrolase [Negativicutes bacterium]|nr:amidohydrolase [Negativicutes bacterium]